MTRTKSFFRFAVVSLLVLCVAVPVFAARGSANFTKFVAIGDSYGSGFESGSLNERHQAFSWPAIIARQAGAPDFQQPLVSFPGLGNELQLVDIISFPPTILPAPGSAAPLNTNLPRPFNNLSIPGANVTDVTTLNGRGPVTGTASSFAQFILRGLGTEVEQAVAQQPTFIAVWIGGNDVLGAVLSGTPRALTPTDVFRTQYNKMLDQLVAGAPNAGMIVGNLPTTTVPYMTTVPSVLLNPVTGLPLTVQGQQIPLIAELGDGTVGPLPAGSLVLLPYSSQIATGFGIPAALGAVDPRFAALPNLGKPLLDAWVLTPTEAAAITARAVEFNQIIADSAAAHNVPVADIKGLFDRFNTPDTPGKPGSGGYHVGPFVFRASFITGGLFSLDGFHMTDIGYSFFANQYIRTINQAYGSQIPVAGISTMFANNGAFFPSQSMVSGAVFFEGMPFNVSDEAAKSMLQFAPQVRHKLRAAGH